MALEFTVYRLEDRPDDTRQGREVAAGPVPDAVRQVIAGHPCIAWIRILDQPYGCGPTVTYAMHPPAGTTFYVHYRHSEVPLHLGAGKVMVFDETGRKLYDGHDGGE